MFPGGIDTGGGGISPSSSATSSSGDAFGGAGSVNVGGFNPPAFGGGNTQLIALGIVAVVVAIYLWKKK